jgi:hypothetical protein
MKAALCTATHGDWLAGTLSVSFKFYTAFRGRMSLAWPAAQAKTSQNPLPTQE